MELQNEFLNVIFSDSLPLIKEYEFKPTKRIFKGQNESANLIINSISESWDNFEISQIVEEKKVTYTCDHLVLSYSISIEFSLHSFEMHMKLCVDDPESDVSHISFIEYPLLAISNPVLLTRQYWLRKPFWSKYGRWMFRYITTHTRLQYTAPDTIHPRFMVHGCVTLPNEVCCAVYSNFRVKPIFVRVKRRKFKKYVELGAYQYSPGIRGMKQPPLEVKLAFLQDYNQDGKIDESDYTYWLNQQLPQNFQNLHKERMWFKIFCSNPKAGTATTFDQVREIIKVFYNVTDGFPQTVFIVGWQMNPKTGVKGHDIDYPRLKHLNTDLGSKEDFWKLFEDMKQYNTIMSCHINIDDAYPSSTGWDESIMCTEKDGTLFRWEQYNNEQCYHISHTKDVESGKIFQRLNEFFESLPVEKMIHIDAMRNSNLNWEKEDFITAIDELYAGLIPIFKYFEEKGIEISMEGLDFHPTEYAGLVSGVWHKKKDRNQAYFGNLVGGGFDKLSDYTTGFAWNIHQDIWWERFQDWDQILDEIFAGSLLSRFLLKHEMKSMNLLPLKRGYDMVFSEDLHAKFRSKTLEISKEDYYIAKDGVFMIPFPEKIYIYSRKTNNSKITLPKEWRNESIKVYLLSKDEKEEISGFSFEGGVLLMTLRSRIPLLIKRSGN
ncbi:MAG: endo-alpha-N-acetylgalactosaminidase family protein [Promethearchaeota archaeon]